MAGWLIIFVAIIYLIVGIDYIITTKIGLGITFIAYAVANLGLYFADKGI